MLQYNVLQVNQIVVNLKTISVKLQVIGDGSSTTINVPLYVPPVSFEVPDLKNLPSDVRLGSASSGSVSGVLSGDKTNVALTLSPAPSAGQSIQFDMSLLFPGV